MKEQAFKKAIVFTDIHYGAQSNSEQHLQDCSDFIDWVIKEGKIHNAETCIFLGDWSHNRNSISVKTLNRSFKDLQKLNNNFEKNIFIIGNHDLYLRSSRELYSSPFLEELSNFTIIDKPTVIGDTAFLPWLIEDEYKDIKKLNVKYIFGHLEIPGFLMNAKIEMPDHEKLLHSSDLTKPELTFSGHFHKRQIKGNVCYIGNCFPHNYADAWDDDRGFMLLEFGKEPEFYNWDKAPKYRTLKLSELLEEPEIFLDEQTHARVTVDVELNFEEVQFIKEIFQLQFNVRRLEFINQHKINENDFEYTGDTQFKSVDQIVNEGINNIESPNIDKNLLVEIYRTLQ